MFTVQHSHDPHAPSHAHRPDLSHFEPAEWGPASQHLDNPTSREAARAARAAQDLWDLRADRPDDN